MFIKHGDGKIMSVFETEEALTDDQKKAVKNLSQKIVKQSDEQADSSDKKSGR